MNNNLHLLDAFERLPYFTLTGFRQTLTQGRNTDQRSRELISRWGQAGHVIPLKRGVYMARRFFELHHNDADFAPAVSSILKPHSYVSLEYILQRSSVLTEITYPITAVTTKNTATIENRLGAFVYQHVKLALYTGFHQRSYYGLIYHLASIPKALFDYLYLRPLPRALRVSKLDMAEDLRLNLDEFGTEAQDEFARYVELSGSEKMLFILDNLRSSVWLP